MKKDIGEKWGKYSPLRAAEKTFFEGAVLDISRLEEPAYQFDNSTVLDLSGYYLQKDVMVDIVEERD